MKYMYHINNNCNLSEIHFVSMNSLLVITLFRILNTHGIYFLRQYVTTWRFKPIMKQFIGRSLVSISVAHWVKLPSTDPQVLSSITTGTFILLNSGKSLNVDFSPQIRFFSCHFQFEYMLEIYIFK